MYGSNQHRTQLVGNFKTEKPHLKNKSRDPRKQGLSAILIRKGEAAQRTKALQRMRLSTSISAVSKDAGISTDFLQQLADAGCFSLVQATETRSHYQPETRIPDDELARFNAQYVSRRYLSRSGRSAVAIKRKLDDAGIEPAFVSLDGKEFIPHSPSNPMISLS